MITAFFSNPFRDQIASKPAVKIVKAAPTEGVPEANPEPNEFYFDIRLCELYLRNAKEAGREFAPRALAITECLYGTGDELTLPVAVGEQLMAQIGQQADAGNGQKPITFHDCLLAGPLPYRGGDIGFFAGLYRVESGNFADSVFSLVADIGGSLGFDLSKYLDIGRQVTTRLPALLGVDTGNWRIGHYAPLYKEKDTYFNRYLILLGEDGEDFDIDSLEVREEDARATLRERSPAGSEAFAKRDYALIRLDSSETRGDYVRFGFHKRLAEIKKYIADRQLEKAEWAKIEQIQEIAESPDLTNLHQHALIAMYRVKIDQWMRNFDFSPTKGASGDDNAEAFEDDLGSGDAIGVAKTAKLPAGTVETLAGYAREWDGFHDLMADQPDDEDFSDTTVESFLHAIRDKKIARVPAIHVAEAVRLNRLSSR